MEIYIIFLISLIFHVVITSLNFNYKWHPLTSPELHIVVMGDFGYEEYKSPIKKKVVAKIKEKHKTKNYNLGIILGDNLYPLGPVKGDHKRTTKIFTESFPKNEFDFDFLTILGNHEYFGDIEEQFEYHKIDTRFYIPERFYKYVVNVNNKFNVSFVCVDSTPIIEEWMIKAFDLYDNYQMDRVEEMLKKNNDMKYTFLLSHHNLIKAFGPHTEFTDDNFLNRLIHKYSIDATLNGHNHNMQYVGPDVTKKAHHFLIGNSAKISYTTTDYTNGKGWYFEKKGGFGELTITETSAKFTYFDEDGQTLKVVNIVKNEKKSASN